MSKDFGVSMYMWWTCILWICTCAESFQKILTEWNEDVEFLSITEDLSHGSFTEHCEWFPDYVKFEFELKTISNPTKKSTKI